MAGLARRSNGRKRGGSAAAAHAGLLLAALALAAPADVAAQSGELIDRTLAIIGEQAITQSDARTAVALGLVPAPAGTTDPAAVTPALIDRLLMLREVQRYAPPEPAPAEIEARLAARRAALPDAQAWAAALAAGGFTEERVRNWIRDDLRIAAYLDQRFADERRADLIADWIADLRRRTRVVELWKPRP